MASQQQHAHHFWINLLTVSTTLATIAYVPKKIEVMKDWVNSLCYQ